MTHTYTKYIKYNHISTTSYYIILLAVNKLINLNKKTPYQRPSMFRFCVHRVKWLWARAGHVRLQLLDDAGDLVDFHLDPSPKFCRKFCSGRRRHIGTGIHIRCANKKTAHQESQDERADDHRQIPLVFENETSRGAQSVIHLPG